ncbi:S8 family serine peptidase [Aquimarina pacifica]|uniref:S8 family serine peptidase n=1 Tax=Aquimarina pacifica TaxID=1296415 RepID=UPI0004B69B4F|nr:S8 family serine peptidase [Aquimarina pacifica]
MEKNYPNPTGAFDFMLKKLLKLNFLNLFTICMVSTFTFAQNTEQKSLIKSRSNLSKLNQLEAQYFQKATKEKGIAEETAKKNGVPTSIQLEDGSFAQLQQLATDGESFLYYKTFNTDAAVSTRTNFLNSGGILGLSLDGQDMTAHVWDGGHARVTHQEYDGPGGNDRVTIKDTNTEGGLQLHYHAAHVTGTIAASGVIATAKGMAPQSKVNAYMWNNDVSEATIAAADGMLLSNHSYGYYSLYVPDQYFGAYIQNSKNWDEVMYNAPYYLMVVAAGNDGTSNYNDNPLEGNSFYDKLTGHAVSKNNLVIANAQDASIDNEGNLISVSIASSSSQGPTDDYRIKPDIAGNGTYVYSTYDDSDTAYASITGTSMASPNVTGSLLLLQQHYENIHGDFMRAATLKGLALHTADDAGVPGPDPIFGWGLLNAKSAAETITTNNSESLVEELVLTNGQSFSFTVDSDGINPLLASISWTDPAGAVNTETNSSTPALVNDLDITVSNGTTTYKPYKLTSLTTIETGDNAVDPFERVDIANASGTYTITVTHKGSLFNELQNYSLVVTGLSVVCEEAITPSDISIANVDYNEATVNWTRVSGASYELRYRQIGTSEWTNKKANSNYYTISELLDETSYELQVKSACDDTTVSAYSNSITFTTTELTYTYCSSKGEITSDEYIGNVHLGEINNTSGAENGYSDFTELSTHLTPGNTNTISITPVWTNSTFNEAYAVWIDYNQNGSFDDSGELVWSQAPSIDSPATGTFIVPDTAKKCQTRMRVSMKYGGIPGSCETFNFGEVEDYTVIIDPDTEAPTAPTELTVSDITKTAATISWQPSNDNQEVTKYEVYQENTLLFKTKQTSITISSLTENTKYSFNVRAKDACGNESDFSGISVITTSDNQCSFIVTSFPYNQGFEDTFGNWEQPFADNQDWVINTNGTPTFSTGPSNASEGAYYIYAEASNNPSNPDQTLLTSPCFDLSKLSSAGVFNFNYHMYGADTLGSLVLEISTDQGVNWTNIWEANGNQGSSWLEAKINLDSYTGKSIKLRFNRITNATDLADIAIDNISLYGFENICQNAIKFDNLAYYTPGDIVIYEGHAFERTATEWAYLGSCTAERIAGIDPQAPPFNDSLYSEALTIFPVPAVDNNIYVQSPKSGVQDYHIFNLIGQLVDSGVFINSIDVQELKTGIYILTVNKESKRFIKQ